MGLIFLSLLIIAAYAWLLLWIYRGWQACRTESDSPINNSPVKATVIVCARNEENHIAQCIDSIENQDYPKDKLEIIIVDDQSTDQTRSIIETNYPNCTLLQTSKTDNGKKAAIKLASHAATGEWLFFTDADCIVPTKWISTMLASADNNAAMLCGPIILDGGNHVLGRFQLLDNMATMAATANGIKRKKYYSANGANMAIKKDSFLDLYRFRNDENIASGDDMFAIQYLANNNPDHVQFLAHKNNLVCTPAEKTWAALKQQRIRWAGKGKHYPNKKLLIIQAFVFCLVLFSTLLLLAGIIGYTKAFIAAAILLVGKTILDYFFLDHLSQHFDQTNVMDNFLASSVAYNIYILWAACIAIFPKSYSWKGREIQP